MSDRWLAIGFSPWKRRFIGSFLGGEVEYAYIVPQKFNSKVTDVVMWSSKIDDTLRVYCYQQGKRLWAMEDGFVRSVGLGVDLVPPLSLVLDLTGIYYDATRPSDLENLLSGSQFSHDMIERAKAVRERIVELKISKYNVGVLEPLVLPKNKRIILIVGQVETDQSILKGSPEIKTNLGLIRKVRQLNPEAYIIYKPHPDVISGARLGALTKADASELSRLVNLESIDRSIVSLLEQVDELHTLTSLSGFEALLRGVKVVTYGLPFYAGWGLTQDFIVCPRRQRKLGLDELVSATLILYPRYVDPEKKCLIEVEDAIDFLYQQACLSQSKDGVGVRFFRWFRNIFLVR